MLHKCVYVVFTCRLHIHESDLICEGYGRKPPMHIPIFVMIIEIKQESNDQHRPLRLLPQNKLLVQTNPRFVPGSLLYKNFVVRFRVDRFKLRSACYRRSDRFNLGPTGST